MADVVRETQYGTSEKANSEQNGLPVLRMNNITYSGHTDLTNIKWCPITQKDEEKFTVRRGDLLFNRTNSPELVGKTAVWESDEKYAFAGYLIRVRFKPELALSNYVSTYLNSPYGKTYLFNKAKPSINMSNISASEFLKIPLPLPPLEEQRRIATILDKADAVRRKRKEAIALTEELLRSAFLEMFGDPVTNPKGWEVVTVNDVVSDVRDGPHVSPEYSDDGIPILSTRNIRPAQLVMEGVKYVSKETYSKLVKQFKPRCGDVLLTKGGTTGFAKAVDWDWSFAIWVHIAALRPTPKIRPEFLEASLNSPNCYMQSQRYTHGIANKDLGLTRIRKIQLSLPPLHLQDQYCNVRRRLLNQLAIQQKSLSESNDLFNSLLQRAFRGEL
jgi:type I restriction enzyme S subunit